MIFQIWILVMPSVFRGANEDAEQIDQPSGFQSCLSIGKFGTVLAGVDYA